MTARSLHTILRRSAVSLAVGAVACVACTTGFAANPAADEVAQVTTMVPGQQKIDDTQAAAALRAFIASQRPAAISGTDSSAARR